MNKMPKKCLVIGYGSIGKRHADVLLSMGCDVSVVSCHAQNIDNCLRYSSVSEAFSGKNYDYVIIANITSHHAETLKKILPYLEENTVCFVEKPLFSSIDQYVDISNRKVVSGYVLRAHPLLRRMKDILQKKRIYSPSLPPKISKPHMTMQRVI